MIVLEDVSIRYITGHLPGPWVLQGVTLSIPSKARVGVIGGKGAGKSTLLRLIAGADTPTSGTVRCDGRISTPAKYRYGLQPLLSGRQNAKFICRINGYAGDLEERLLHIEKLAGLGKKFDNAVKTYTPVMKASLTFAFSMALDFDVYVSDGFNFSGATAFKDKAAADAALMQLSEQAGLIMTAPKGASGEANLKRYCRSGIWLHEGKAEWFDDIHDAIDAYRASLPPAAPRHAASQAVQPAPEHVQRILARMKQLQISFRVLAAGLQGTPATVSEKQSAPLLQAAGKLDMMLLEPAQITERGYRIKEGSTPVLRKRTPASAGELVDLYDLETQCVEMESSK